MLLRETFSNSISLEIMNKYDKSTAAEIAAVFGKI